MALKRANGEGNLRKRSNGTWEARVTVGVNPETGKLISKSVYGRTQKEVREKLNALQKGEQQAVNPPAAGPGIASEAANEPEQKEMTVGEWLDTWLKEYLADVKQGTSIHYESVVRLHLKPALGDIPLSQLRTPWCKSFITSSGLNNEAPNISRTFMASCIVRWTWLSGWSISNAIRPAPAFCRRWWKSR